MPTPGNREIVAAKSALHKLLATNLLPDVSITRFLASLPADERLNNLSERDALPLAEQLEGFLIFSVHFLLGRLSQSQPEDVSSVASHNLEDVLLALLALQPEFSVAEEHYLLLADLYRRRGCEDKAAALLEFLAQPSGVPN